MLKFLKKKKNRIILLTILMFGILFSAGISNFMNFPGGLNSVENDNEIDTIEKDNTQLLKTSQLDDFQGNGTEVNIELQESIIDTTPKSFANLDNSNSFTEPSPIFSGFNTSFANITVEDIYAPNKTLQIETDGLGDGFESYFLGEYYVSFKTKGSGYIEDISMFIKNATATASNITIKLYNATENVGIPYPDTDLGLIVSETQLPLSQTYFWYTFSDIHAFYNSSNSYDQTFFFRVEKVNGGSLYWDWYSDGSDADETYVYDGALSLETFGAFTIDLKYNLSISTDNHNPKPTDINLEINGLDVNNIGSNNEGYLDTTQGLLQDLSGDIQFDITADWWDVSCNVTSVQINYTKSDINVNSTYLIPDKDSNVQWNVDAGTLNYFDSRINHTNNINFTVPSDWPDGNIKVYDDILEKTQLSMQDLGNGLREVMVIDGGNGINWYLTVNTTNLLDDVITEVNSVETQVMNYTNGIDLFASFGETIHNGTIDLDIYSPTPQYLNHTSTLVVSSSLSLYFSPRSVISFRTAIRCNALMVTPSRENEVTPIWDWIICLADFGSPSFPIELKKPAANKVVNPPSTAS